jgi:hypothetical protein
MTGNSCLCVDPLPSKNSPTVFRKAPCNYELINSHRQANRMRRCRRCGGARVPRASSESATSCFPVQHHRRVTSRSAPRRAYRRSDGHCRANPPRSFRRSCADRRQARGRRHILGGGPQRGHRQGGPARLSRRRRVSRPTTPMCRVAWPNFITLRYRCVPVRARLPWLLSPF